MIWGTLWAVYLKKWRRRQKEGWKPRSKGFINIVTKTILLMTLSTLYGPAGNNGSSCFLKSLQLLKCPSSIPILFSFKMLKCKEGKQKRRLRLKRGRVFMCVPLSCLFVFSILFQVVNPLRFAFFRVSTPLPPGIGRAVPLLQTLSPSALYVIPVDEP